MFRKRNPTALEQKVATMGKQSTKKPPADPGSGRMSICPDWTGNSKSENNGQSEMENKQELLDTRLVSCVSSRKPEHALLQKCPGRKKMKVRK